SHDNQVHVILWEIATGKVKRRWDWDKGRDPHSSVEDITFSPDGKQIAVAVFRRSEARILDVAGEKQQRLAHNEIYGLDFAPDGTALVTAGWDRTIRLWNPATGELRQQTVFEKTPNQDTRLYGVRWSPDGRTLATSTMSREVAVWDARSLLMKGR